MHEDLDAHLGDYYEKYGKRYHDIQASSKLWVDHTQADMDNDMNHIDYVIPVNEFTKTKTVHTVYC
jgi:hypothetical protein